MPLGKRKEGKSSCEHANYKSLMITLVVTNRGVLTCGMLLAGCTWSVLKLLMESMDLWCMTPWKVLSRLRDNLSVKTEMFPNLNISLLHE